MVLKGGFAALLFTTLLGATLPASSSASADEYSAGEFFTLDLPHAVLSPKRLGPPTQFEPVAVKAKVDRVAEAALAEARPVRTVKVTRVHVARRKPVRTAKLSPAVLTKLVHKHSNPLDAQAFDTRIQVWPCRSGGICNWQPAKANRM